MPLVFAADIFGAYAEFIASAQAAVSQTVGVGAVIGVAFVLIMTRSLIKVLAAAFIGGIAMWLVVAGLAWFRDRIDETGDNLSAPASVVAHDQSQRSRHVIVWPDRPGDIGRAAAGVTQAVKA